MSIRSYDLHSHSNQSDGILSPEALVSRAKEKGVSVLSLTDHDTTSGLDAAKAQAAKEGIAFVNGVEFSCLWEKRGIHIVALGFDEHHEAMRSAVAAQSQRRCQRAQEIGERLSALGFSGAFELAKSVAGEAAIGRPHFAQALVEIGAVSSLNQAFKKYLGAGKVGDVKQIWPEFNEICASVKEAGGISVIAHPLKYKMTRSKLCKMTESFVEAGGEAIEVVSGVQRADHTNDMAKIANRFGLLGSCGSDFHAPSMPWAELGKVSDMPENVVPIWSRWEHL